jgi:GTP cyclohydrolase II
VSRLNELQTRHAILLNVEKAVVSARCGGPLVIGNVAGAARLAQAAEAITGPGLARFAELSGSSPGLVLTAQRVLALGGGGGQEGAVVLPSIDGIDLAELNGLVDPTAEPKDAFDHLARCKPAAAASCEAAAVRLATIAGLLPAALIAALPADAKDLVAWARAHELPVVWVDEILGYHASVAASLRPVIEARVPLARAEEARVVAFRSEMGGVEHFAIIVGQPRTDQPVLARLHSECFTGDLLGSLCCDCGDQLHEAIEVMAKAKGGGILLYLAQEGRGIGLVNKLRAYVLQDRGFDTVEANQQLGFRSDERCYRPAAEMLRQLGFAKVRLMTNNPEKVAALVSYGIEVVQRVPLALAPNSWNAAYLRTKAVRTGHLLEVPDVDAAAHEHTSRERTHVGQGSDRAKADAGERPALAGASPARPIPG